MAHTYYQKLAAEQQALAQLIRDTERELSTNPAYQPYFADYTAASVADFIEHYARRKAHYLYHGPRRAQLLEHEATAVRDKAYERLWDIQQKKLFDLQCQWRAGLITLSEVEVVEQFEYWGHHPDRCSFLPPITAEELALYRRYLANPACPAGDWYDHCFGPGHWQDYYVLRSVCYADELERLPPDSHVFRRETNPWLDEAEDLDEEDDSFDGEDEDAPPPYPAWYRYYDQHLGTGDLRHLPNVRGMRQQFYVDLHFRNFWTRPLPPAALPANPGVQPASAAMPASVPDTRRQWVEYDEKELFRLIATQFDPTPGLLELRRSMDAGVEYHHCRAHDEALVAFHTLVEAPLPVPIVTPAADWRPALTLAVHELRRRQLLDALPLAYEEYCQRLALGLQLEPPYPPSGYPDDLPEPSSITYARANVLHGRELNGEPRDFNF
jgi:hypothetical protein